jgi:hypothetical protein
MARPVNPATTDPPTGFSTAVTCHFVGLASIVLFEVNT